MTPSRPAPLGHDHAALLERSKTYHDIKWRLRQQLGKQWGPGVRLPPIKALARRLKTGQTNTHRAVKELVREGLLISRPGQGTFVTPNVETEPLWTASTPGDLEQTRAAPLTGLWVEILTSQVEPMPFIRWATDPFHAAMVRHGCRVTRSSMDRNQPDMLAAHRESDALLIVNPNFEKLQCGPRQSMAIVSTGHDLNLPSPRGYDVIMPDSEQGSALAGEHLRQTGCQLPCFLGCKFPDEPGEYDLTSTHRLRGFEVGWGQKVKPEHRFVLTHYMSTEGAKAVARFLQLSPRPDAVFAASDELAIGFIHGALAHGLTPGRDFQIVGFDSQLRSRELISGPLTSIEVPMRRMGELAATMLAQRMLDPLRSVHRIALGCTLFQGSTTRNVSSPNPLLSRESGGSGGSGGATGGATPHV